MRDLLSKNKVVGTWGSVQGWRGPSVSAGTCVRRDLVGTPLAPGVEQARVPLNCLSGKSPGEADAVGP